MPIQRKITQYDPSYFGKEEESFQTKFLLQLDDARNYFKNFTKPRMDRAYKLYVSYNGDRANEIQDWQSNVCTPYILATIETMMPRILDARPDFTVQGRTEKDQDKAIKLQQLNDYTWELSEMDDQTETLVKASMIYGTSWLMSYWKKDVRKGKFFAGKDINSNKKKFVEKSVTKYDAPYAEAVDGYSLWYDWRNTTHGSKQFWFLRRVMNGSEIKRAFPSADPTRLALALSEGARRNHGDLQDYASIRFETKSTHTKKAKNADRGSFGFGSINDRYQGNQDPGLIFHEVLQRWRPFDDAYDIEIDGVPVIENREQPIPYDYKEAPFIDFPFIKMPFEYEGMGYPLLLENAAVMLDLIKNQRLDAATLNIHKMWIVNPLANIKKEQLVVRPFGIIYSGDPNGVREVQFSDIKQSAYQEEEALKADMRYASGVDDFSMGVGGNVDSATEAKHLRESTLERVRLFVNHLGSGYSRLLRYWISMYGQFMTKDMEIRITDADGQESYELIEKDDLMGNFDYKAEVIPSIAGKNDIEKKQNMDLFQLLINMPFVDPEKLTNKTLYPWKWSVASIKKDETPQMGQALPGMPPGATPVGPDGQPIPPEALQAMMAGGAPTQGGPASPAGAPGLPQGAGPALAPGSTPGTSQALPQAVKNALALLAGSGQSPFAEAATPIPIAKSPTSSPPTAPKIGKTTNPRGANRGGRVNTNFASTRGASDMEAQLLNRVNSIQM